MTCDPKFGQYEFVKPEIYDEGYKNKECKIKIKRLTFQGIYKCKFQRCNPEENNFYKTDVLTNSPLYSASIFIKVKLCVRYN